MSERGAAPGEELEALREVLHELEEGLLQPDAAALEEALQRLEPFRAAWRAHRGRNGAEAERAALREGAEAALRGLGNVAALAAQAAAFYDRAAARLRRAEGAYTAEGRIASTARGTLAVEG